ncbi:hypothetical protein SAMN04488556_3985 [Halostagnicola kamekurae]|uniref:Uncharacterized protein n=1 Tax=Halostagnicola kamekurae TaxID=619731 RepID=A0A1I6UPA4_9EURY|nr:hypothetical protein SAMN04488556_3985 [Halostagnicola kamekurae]
MSMQETVRLTEHSGFPELEFIEQEVTPKFAIKLSIQHYLVGLPLADTVSILAGMGAMSHNRT